jgi:excisionase family DNA binding protein
MRKKDEVVMTVDEVAGYLRIPRSSVYKLAQEGRIPCQKAGRQWRFHRAAIDEWLSRTPQMSPGER